MLAELCHCRLSLVLLSVIGVDTDRASCLLLAISDVEVMHGQAALSVASMYKSHDHVHTQHRPDNTCVLHPPRVSSCLFLCLVCQVLLL